MEIEDETFRRCPDFTGVLSLALADEKMSQAIEQLQNMPEMNELMQQLQKGGEELSPEMQQQLEKLQKMLQQLEQ